MSRIPARRPAATKFFGFVSVAIAGWAINPLSGSVGRRGRKVYDDEEPATLGERPGFGLADREGASRCRYAIESQAGFDLSVIDANGQAADP